MLSPNDPSYHRQLRARQFTDQVMHLLEDFLPMNDKICRNRIFDFVYEAAYQSNAQIINVPPEYDALNKLELERKMLASVTLPFIMKKGD